MGDNLALFDAADLEKGGKGHQQRPLADRLRPETFDEFEGLTALDPGLVEQLKSGRGKPPSLVLWGPPGSGKTTLARLIGKSFQCGFVSFSAVLGGVKEVREIVSQAKRTTLPTILFVDEIHRFNKAQQDAFLPHVEDGTIVLLGATTENPSFSLTGALLSRLKVVVLGSLPHSSLERILARAESAAQLVFADDARSAVISFSGGDARRLLNLVEALSSARHSDCSGSVTAVEIRSFLKDSKTLFYDRDGEEHYNMASAFIKSMRGSDPDAALYWGFRMLESGEEPRFLLRRMIIFASEDIGNADPRALQVAVAAAEAFERVGLPEGRIPIAQSITYLASAPKSNRSYMAMHAALVAIAQHPKVGVPLNLRNAPTKLMKELEYGKDYQYPHSFENAHVGGVQYLPDELKGKRFYEPSERGYEKTINERLAVWRGKS
jgi:putative ATPase